MKKLLCFLMSFVFIFSLAACGDKGSKEDEPLILDLAQKKMLEDIEFKVIDEDGTVWLENKDVQMVLVTYEESKSRYLDLRLTADGATSFKNAVKKGTGELSITVNGEKLTGPVIQ